MAKMHQIPSWYSEYLNLHLKALKIFFFSNFQWNKTERDIEVVRFDCWITLRFGMPVV